MTTKHCNFAQIIIVTFDSNDVILGCLEALNNQSNINFSVIIVDNSPPEAALRELPTYEFHIEILHPGKNLGFAGGCNFGAEKAISTWLIMLNPDTRVEPEWFHELTLSMEQYPGTNSWASTLLHNDKPELLDGFGDVFSIFGISWRGGYKQPADIAPNKDAIIFGPCGAAAAYRRSVFEDIGGLDPTYFCYLEDIDIALRLNLSKHTSRISHKARVRHIGGDSSKNNKEFPIIKTYENNSYLLIKNLPLTLLMIMWPMFLLIQFWVIFRNRNDGLHDARISGWRRGQKLWRVAWKNRNKVAREPGCLGHLWSRMCKSYFKLRKLSIFVMED